MSDVLDDGSSRENGFVTIVPQFVLARNRTTQSVNYAEIPLHLMHNSHIHTSTGNVDN